MTLLLSLMICATSFLPMKIDTTKELVRYDIDTIMVAKQCPDNKPGCNVLHGYEYYTNPKPVYEYKTDTTYYLTKEQIELFRIVEALIDAYSNQKDVDIYDSICSPLTFKVWDFGEVDTLSMDSFRRIQ